jgi:ketosteroid isomerase-like protein
MFIYMLFESVDFVQTRPKVKPTSCSIELPRLHQGGVMPQEQQIGATEAEVGYAGEQSEIEIQQFLQDFAATIRSGDIDKIMSFYADDIVAYDMIPPLDFRGVETYRKSWEECFTSYFQFPVIYDYRDQKIFSSGDYAFCHSLVHMTGKAKKDGKEVECWTRNTVGLKKFGKNWKIIHEHNSVPLEAETGIGLMNLKPAGQFH